MNSATRVSFRVAILTLVLALLGLTSGFLIAFMFSKERESIDHLKATYLRELADVTAREAGRLPEIASSVLQECARLSDSNLLPRDQPEALARTFAERLRAHPNLTWVSYGSTNGRFVGATRAGSNIVLNFSHPAQNGGVPKEFALESSGALLPFVREPPLSAAYDPRTRDWFRRAALDPGRIIWMPPYQFAEGVLGLTCALADSTDAGGAPRGVFTADFSMEGISDYLGKLKVAENGFAVLLDGRGHLLATPAAARLGGSARALIALASRAMNEVSLTNFNSTVTVDHQTHDTLSRAVAPGTGLDWIVLVIVPSNDFLGFVEANRRATLIILAISVCFALLLGAILSGSISKPLAAVANELSRVAQFEFDDRSPRPSRLKEVDLVQSALNAMKASLRSFSRYAPEEIVRQIALSGREAALSGERREVSLLFCDLRGFTHFSEKTSPEQVVALLNTHFDAMVAIVLRHKGYVCDFLGDSLFVVFGAPSPSISHAGDAVACALEMQRARNNLNAQGSSAGLLELEMGIGINTGPCVVGNMGSVRRIKYGIVGSAVNLASRIETFTVGGQILISDATHSVAGNLRADGPFFVEGKGVGAKISIWDVYGVENLPSLQITRPAGDLAVLAQPLRVAVRKYQGKSLQADSIEGVISQLSERAARLSCETGLDPFSAIQIVIASTEGNLVLDAKVRSLEGQVALISFTGVDPEARARLARLILNGVSR